MNPKLKAALKLFRKYKPSTPDRAMRKCGVELKFLNDGAFRSVFRLVGLGAVIKFPLEYCNAERQHTRDEMRAIRSARGTPKIYKIFKKHLPRVYWYDGKHGVIITPEYSRVSTRSPYNPALHRLRKKIQKYWRRFDDNQGNFGVTKTGTIVIQDLGIIGSLDYDRDNWYTGGIL